MSRKIAMQLRSSLSRSLGGVSLVRKNTKVNTFAIFVDVGNPLASVLVPRHALLAGAVVPAFLPVLRVLRAGGEPKVRPGVIHRVAVNVVNNLTWPCGKNKAVKIHHSSRFGRGDLPISVCLPLADKSGPIKAFNQRNICGVNASLKAASEGNKGKCAVDAMWSFCGHFTILNPARSIMPQNVEM